MPRVTCKDMTIRISSPARDFGVNSTFPVLLILLPWHALSRSSPRPGLYYVEPTSSDKVHVGCDICDVETPEIRGINLMNGHTKLKINQKEECTDISLAT